MPKPKDPEWNAYIRSLTLVWLITFIWLGFIYWVYFIQKPSLTIEILIGIPLTGFCPMPSDLFYSFEKYKQLIKEFTEPREKAPVWLEEMRKR